MNKPAGDHRARSQRVLLCFVVGLLGFSGAVGEYYSSIDAMQKLGKAEAELVQIYRQYLDTQKRELDTFRSFSAVVKSQHKLASKEVEEYLGSPANAYGLIKRNVIDWSHLNELVKQRHSVNKLKAALDELQRNVSLPNERDLSGAVDGLARMQEVYGLNTTSLMDGIINGTYYDSKLSWRDSFIIGSKLFDLKAFARAIDWLERTIQMIDEETATVDDDEAENVAISKGTRVGIEINEQDYIDEDDQRIENSDKNRSNDPTPIGKYFIEALQYLALANYELGLFDRALVYMGKILHISPEHDIKIMYRVLSFGNPPKKEIADRTAKIDWYANYTRLCRGIQLPEEIHNNLQCRLETKGNAYFQLAPLKREELSIDPDISLYHGILSERNIENVLNESKAIGTSRSLWDNAVNDTRVSQQSWLPYKSPTLRMIYRIATEVTGLDMRNSEWLQVANYGLGGQFEAHCDTLGVENIGPAWEGDRIATLMFYLSNVEQGGYTIYPNLNMYVRPEKGALLVWYNMHRSLDDDFRTMHAGCPLLKGTKRIANIWIHSGYQEFRRPCELERDNYKSYGYTCNE